MPEVAAQVVGTVVQVVAGTARELQSRNRRNTFLDRVNQELFMPRGLYAMVMAFKDVVPGEQPRGPLSKLAGAMGKSLFSSQRRDINQTVAKYSKPNSEISKTKKGLQNMRLTSGKTYGDIELPEAAQLVYPDLDRSAQADLEQGGKGKNAEDERIMDKWKGAGKWVQDYLDRKAQASYVSSSHRANHHFFTSPTVYGLTPTTGDGTSRLTPYGAIIIQTSVRLAFQRSEPLCQQRLARLPAHRRRRKPSCKTPGAAGR